MSLVWFLTWLGVLILLSAFFSCSETSLFALNGSDLTYLDVRLPRAARRIRGLLTKPRRTLITILIGNMFVNILSTAKCEKYMHQNYPKAAILLSLAVMTPLILILGEITPKLIAFRLKRKITPVISAIIRFQYIVLYPLQHAVFIISNPFIRFFSILFPAEQSPGPRYNQDEIKAAVEIGVSRKLFGTYEKTLIENLVGFDEVTARFVLTPRTELDAVDIRDPMEIIKAQIQASPYSRIPVFRGSRDSIIGVFLRKELFRDREVLDSREAFQAALTSPYFEPETIPVRQLFHLMVTRQTHLHFIVDEFGGVEGMVTMNDILAHIFGDIDDKDSSRDEITLKENTADTYTMDARLAVDYFNRQFQPGIDEKKWVTIGGFLADQLDHIPAQGDQVLYQHYRFTVTEAEERGAVRIEMTELPQEDHE